MNHEAQSPETEDQGALSRSASLCRHLRSKKMYVAGSFEAEAQADEDAASAYGHYWCMQTMYEFGPDDERVQRKTCKPGRSCYEPS